MNNGRPALHASRIFYLPSERDHHQDAPQKPGPNVRVSPLIQPQGESGEIELRDCRKCAVRAECRPEKFALEVCEKQLSRRRYTRAGEWTNRGIRHRSNRDAILDAIRSRKRFTSEMLAYDTELPSSTIRGHLYHLLQDGMIRSLGREGKTLVYELVEVQ